MMRMRSARYVVLVGVVVTAVAATIWLGFGRGSMAPIADLGRERSAVSNGSSMAIDTPAASREPRPRMEESAPPERAALPGPPVAPPTERIVGRVLDPNGKPVPRAIVAALPLVQGDPVRKGLKTVTSGDDEGRFTLEPPDLRLGQEVALVARCPGWRPATERWFWNGAPGNEEHVLRLERGYALAGHIVLNGVGVKAGVTVDLHEGLAGVFGFRTGAPPPIRIDDAPKRLTGQTEDPMRDEMFWLDGRLEEKRATVHTADDGAFRFEGLGPRPHRLRVALDTFPRPPQTPLNQHVVEVTPPDEAILIDLGEAEIEVRASSLGDAFAGARVTCRAANGRQCIQTVKGHSVAFACLPGSELDVTAKHPKCRSVTQRVWAPASGQRAIVDLPLVVSARPSLVVVLRGAARLGIGSIVVGVDAAQPGPLIPPAVRTPGSDRFEVAAVVDPGECRLTIDPCADPADPGHYLLPAEATATIPTSGTATVELEPVLAGRFELEVVDTSHRSYHATVYDAMQQPRLEFHLRFQEWRPGSWSRRSNIRYLGSEPTELRRQHEHLLRPGPYRLQLEVDGLEPIWRAIEMRAGETTRCSVTLPAAGAR